jgi:hypothetical protein
MYGRSLRYLIPPGYKCIGFRPANNETVLTTDYEVWEKCYSKLPRIILKKINPLIPGMNQQESDEFFEKFNKTVFCKMFKPISKSSPKNGQYYYCENYGISVSLAQSDLDSTECIVFEEI